MGKYAAELNRTASLTLPVGSLAVANTRRYKLYDLVVGSDATPQDSIFLWKIRNTTAAGTSTAVTLKALDASDVAAASTAAGANHTVDATPAGISVLDIPLNQRATFRWVAAPGGELIAPAVNASGHAIYTPTASALLSVYATAHIEEL